jgi:gliding motility-associated lipoprotein GldB
MKMKKILNFLLISLVIFGCGEKDACNDAPDASNIPVTVTIERVEEELFKNKSKAQIRTYLQKDKLLANHFFNVNKYPNDSLIVNSLYNTLNHPSLDTVYRETQAVFGDMKDVKAQFEEAFRNIKYYYPDFYIPKIKTIITGLNNDLYVSDSLIVIGLDFFLGPKGTYIPNIPNYVLKRYQKQYLVSIVVSLISQKYNQVNMLDKSLLAEMIYYGKSYEFVKTMMPCTNDTIVLGYDKQEVIDCDIYESVIWANFVQNNLLFKTDHFTVNKFVGESPKTYEIGDKCPGRIGRWVGWRIIQKYRKENEAVKIQDLMKNNDAKKIFEASKYKPEKKK